jgi:hypothetical protein
MNISTWVTQENITLGVAIFGLLLSFYNLIKDFLGSRNKIHIICRSRWSENAKEKPYFIFNLVLENNSKLPVAVSRMFLLSCKSKFEFQYSATNVWEFTTTKSGEMITRKTIDTVEIPVTLPGLGVTGGYFKVFVDSNVIDVYKTSTTATFEIFTNRGKKKISFPIPQDIDDIEQYGYTSRP